MTQPPKGGPAFANTPAADISSRPPSAAPSANKSQQPPPAPPTPPAGAGTNWSTQTTSTPDGAYPGTRPPAAGGGTGGFGQPTISNGANARVPGAAAPATQTTARPATATAAPAPTPAGATGGGAAATGPRRPARGPRRARLQLRHFNPWSVLKFSCVLSVFLFFMWMLTIAGLYEALNGAGVIGKINDTVTTINGAGSDVPVTVRRVLGSAVLIGVINMVMFIALSTVGSIIYNFIADLIGGVELTLSEGD